jgi:DNA-binding IclR family transcriptional regulator
LYTDYLFISETCQGICMANNTDLPNSYRVPALDKGLDILECLSESGVPMSQAQIARALGRSPSEIFRMLATLERRGYLLRDPVSGAYALTLKLFELGQAHSPFDELVRAARWQMRELATTIRQSIHLSVIRGANIVVLHQEEGPTRVRLSIETGSAIPVLNSASGRLLLAATSDADRDEFLSRSTPFPSMTDEEQSRILAQLARIREQGYESSRSEHVPGVSDVSVLIGSLTSKSQAALAVAALTSDHDRFVRDHVGALLEYAAETSRILGLR